MSAPSAVPPTPTQEEFFGTEEPGSYADLKANRASVDHFALPRIVITADRDITHELGDFAAAVFLRKADVRGYYARRCARHALVAFLAGLATGAVAALAAVMVLR